MLREQASDPMATISRNEIVEALYKYRMLMNEERAR